MNHKRVILLTLLAASLIATFITLRSSASAPAEAPASVAEVDAQAQQLLRYRQAQPRHWRYVMLRQ